MKDLILREFQQWNLQKNEYLSLPLDKFTVDCPPMLMIGEPSLTASPCLLVISLEPLLDHKTYLSQLKYLRVSEEGAESRVIEWQQNYFKIFPNLLRSQSAKTHYWGDMNSLIQGWSRLPYNDTQISWAHLENVYAELPLIPMHAKSHTALTALSPQSQEAIRLLFEERLLQVLEKYHPAAVLALGADSVAETRKILNAEPPGEEVRLTPYEPQFGRNAGRYQRTIQAFTHSRKMPKGILFARNAPLTNWHRPNRTGIYEIGRCLRKFVETRQNR